MVLFLVLALAISILAGIFALQNSVPITVWFLFWEFEGSLALVLLCTFALGVVVSLLVSAPAMIRKRLAVANQNRRINELEKRLEQPGPSQRTSPKR
jgi:lipopolysaccharide assembly protein A